VVDAAPAADAQHDAGSITPVVTGAALVALIGGAAVFVARRRRRTE
jgi:LPXTG-motif cell wall-anchored protein